MKLSWLHTQAGYAKSVLARSCCFEVLPAAHDVNTQEHDSLRIEFHSWQCAEVHIAYSVGQEILQSLIAWIQMCAWVWHRGKSEQDKSKEEGTCGMQSKHGRVLYVCICMKITYFWWEGSIKVEFCFCTCRFNSKRMSLSGVFGSLTSWYARTLRAMRFSRHMHMNMTSPRPISTAAIGQSIDSPVVPHVLI